MKEQENNLVPEEQVEENSVEEAKATPTENAEELNEELENIAELFRTELAKAQEEAENQGDATEEEAEETAEDAEQTEDVELCACCGEELETEAHTGTDTANCTHGNICDICNIEYSEKLGHVYDDENDKQCNVCEKEVNTHVIEVVVTESDTETDEETDSDGDTEETTEADTEDASGANTESDDETEENSTSSEKETVSENGDSSSTPTEDGGCGSFAGFGTVAVVAVSAISGLVSFKKKKED